ncbi:TetR/AcrR family transcriptional regulator [Streptacidiphilus fuscans]|uniref:TetR/AcrR family transcriptional regulator n=1 Tax=Streptacidiphilus fuscans TaxID=2789292 RepID=A0A931F9I2_9ACTN|nr:TetR/AcrR family transcriptional regulator [Streptacidiphilus fuscans]MBF9066647.1 TetR/AcrR family transcriptional regulator [Streptacidiphilus fuscans]
MSPTPERPLRADASRNQERLLEVAAEAFGREGAGASLKAIAMEAGVGIGTLYRRFPTREALVESVYRNEVARLCASSPVLLGQLHAVEALRAWMRQFVDFMATKHAMADALRQVLASEDDRMHTRFLLRDAIATLLDAGVAEGTIRPGLDAYDLMMALGGVTLIADGPEQRDMAMRLLDFLIDGVRAA